jgi:hypothetical protein
VIVEVSLVGVAAVEHVVTASFRPQAGVAGAAHRLRSGETQCNRRYQLCHKARSPAALHELSLAPSLGICRGVAALIDGGQDVAGRIVEGGGDPAQGVGLLDDAVEGIVALSQGKAPRVGDGLHIARRIVGTSVFRPVPLADAADPSDSAATR